MEDDLGIDKIVSQFFLDTCQRRFRVDRVGITALLRSVDVIANLARHIYEPDDGEFHATPLITGLSLIHI